MKNKIITLIILFFGLSIASKAQSSFYQPMGTPDLPFPAINLSFDTNNIVYAVCASADSVFVSSFDSVNNQWNRLAATYYPNSYNTQSKATTPTFSFFLNGEHFLILSTGVQGIYKQNGNTITFLTKIDSMVTTKVFVYKDTAFLLGENLQGTHSILQSFNGTSLLDIYHLPISATKDNLYSPSTIIDDKIYVTNQSLFVQLNIWEHDLKTHSTNSYFSAFLSVVNRERDILINNNGNLTYQNKYLQSVYNFTGNKITDSFSYNLRNYNLTIFKGKYIMHRKNDIWIRELNNFKQVLNDYDYGLLSDSGILVSNGNKSLFALPFKKIYHSVKNDSLNLARLDLDSISFFTIDITSDTLFIQAFYDKDESGTYTVGDSSISGQFTGKYVTGNFNKDSFYSFHLPNDREYLVDASSFSNCFELPFTGSLSTDFLILGKTTDTLIFPFVLKKAAYQFDLKLTSDGRARINSRSSIFVNITNTSCNTSTPSCNLVINIPSKANFISSSTPYRSLNNNKLTFNIPVLSPGQTVIFSYLMEYKSPNYSLNDTALHYAELIDTNTYAIYDKDSTILRLVYSYDPNEKISQPQGKITKDIDMIRYVIHFQNEGNDYAERVTVVDTIDKRMPVLSFTMRSSSHPYTVSIQNNVVTWVFDKIYLLPKSQDDEKSRGYVIFEAKVNGKMANGDSIRNKAHIYFDYNSPITTNYAVIRRGSETDGVKQLAFGNLSSMLIYPNPTKSKVVFKNVIDTPLTIRIYNVLGSHITTIALNKQAVQEYDVSALSAGMYLLKIVETGEIFKLMVE